MVTKEVEPNAATTLNDSGSSFNEADAPKESAKISDILRRHLLNARRELVSQRDGLNREIAEIDAKLRGSAAGGDPGRTTSADLVTADANDEALRAVYELMATSCIAEPSRLRTLRNQLAHNHIRTADRDDMELIVNLLHACATLEKATSAPDMSRTIVAYLDKQTNLAKTQQIARDLSEANGWAEASVRKQLSRLAQDGDIASPKRGFYASWSVWYDIADKAYAESIELDQQRQEAEEAAKRAI